MCMCSLYGSRTISPSPVLYSCRHTNSQAVVTCAEMGGLWEESEWTTNSAMVCTGADLGEKWKLFEELVNKRGRQRMGISVTTLVRNKIC